MTGAHPTCGPPPGASDPATGEPRVADVRPQVRREGGVPLAGAEIIAAQLERIEREVGGFAGLIDTWDTVNDAVRRLGRVGVPSVSAPRPGAIRSGASATGSRRTRRDDPGVGSVPPERE